jgi:hypothetical protein
MWSIIAASVVDLPEPVVPVSRMIPRGSSASRRTTSGRPRSSIVRTWKGMARSAIETAPLCLKALTRKRETPSSWYEKSASPFSSNSARTSGLAMSLSAASVSLGASCSEPWSAQRSPWTRATGGESALMWRSEPSRSTTCASA